MNVEAPWRIADIEQRVCDVVSLQLSIPREQMEASDRLIEDLHCDSLDVIEILMDLEDAFCVTLTERPPSLICKAVFTRSPFRLSDLAELIHIRQGTGTPCRKRVHQSVSTPAPSQALPFLQLDGTWRPELPSRQTLFEPLSEGHAPQFRRRSDGMRCVLIPAARVEIGSEAELASRDERPVHEVELDAYLIDAEPVSTTAFCRFLNSTEETNPQVLGDWFMLECGDDRGEHMLVQFNGSEWRPVTGAERWPMVLVSWYGANAYSLWANGRVWGEYRDDGDVEEGSFLPTEAQWEHAARGPCAGAYPWGDEPPAPDRMRFGKHRAGETYLTSDFPLAAVNDLLGMSPFGLHHMAGNVWQWCRDWYDDGFYRTADALHRNPCNRLPTRVRSERGGSWIGPAELCRSSYRRGRNPIARGRCLGFRCVSAITDLPRNRRMLISIPKLSLVVLIGPSGSGKSTFARRHFLSSEVLSSDACRGLVSDDENEQGATKDAFEVLHYVAAKRLARGRLTVVDATNVQPEARAPLVALARKYHCLPVAVALDLPETTRHERNRDRPERAFGPHVIRQQRSQLRRGLKGLKREGFRHVFVFESVEQVEAAVVERVRLWNDRSHERGPFDIIGDVHGCAGELEELLARLGYAKGLNGYSHPAGRKAVFVGDLVDRGPRVLDVLAIVRTMIDGGTALCVPGNHDMKLLKKLRGRDVQITHGLAQTLAEIEALPEDERGAYCTSLASFLDGLVSHYVLDDGKLVVAHAGMKEEMQGRGSGKVRDFALYGETTGETDEFGLPVRYNWAAEYRGQATVVYGHTPVPEPEWLNRTVNVDTGCVFGGKLTALRYPEKEFVSVPAKQTYCEPARPFLPAERRAPQLTAQQVHDDLLDAEDVIGKRIVSTRLHHNVTIREENATAALEVMSRFAANPKWLIYLPPTMSPSETTTRPGLLEHPAEAFAYFRNQGVPQVVCEEKHMGSRAVVVVCRDEAAARERFGVTEEECGIVYTRTGRRFFNDAELERRFLERLQASLTAAGFWEEADTTWACFDCELMPWSAKAQELLRSQYAAVGAAGKASLPTAVSSLEQAAARLHGEANETVAGLLAKYCDVRGNVEKFVTAYRQYCWSVESLDDLRLAPFHLLATEGKVHTHQNHLWHMERLAKICQHDPMFLLATQCKTVDVTDANSEQAGVDWWDDLTARGGEGMVVKPLEFIMRGKKGLVQPAVKCRGREYLRIIYGPDCTADEHLSRLRNRGLGAKRSLALREFALGIEALERFVRHEPLRRVHECAFGVLALESEPVDPRL